MRVTIIKDDNSVYVDGVCRTVDCNKLPADMQKNSENARTAVAEFLGRPALKAIG